MLTIYGKKNCYKCVEAYQKCKRYEVPYRYLLLDEDYTKEELLALFPDTKELPVVVDEHGNKVKL